MTFVGKNKVNDASCHSNDLYVRPTILKFPKACGESETNFKMWSIAEASNKLSKGIISSTEIFDICMKQLVKTKYLNAYITVCEDLGRKQALNSDKRRSKTKLGVLDGIPIAVKDNFCTKDVKTTCASKMLENYIPPYSATVVERLIQAGAVLVGKTNMDEFAMGSSTINSIIGPSRNPWNCGNSTDNKTNNWSIAGGSSGGSAVAVASRSCFGALSSDTGGSTRNPAAHCGIVGLKPSYGLLSRNGLIPLTNSLDAPGIMAKTVDDVVSILNTVAGPDTRDSTCLTEKFTPISIQNEPSVKGLRIGIPKEFNTSDTSEEITKLWNKVADMFEKSGAEVKPVSLPHSKYCVSCYSVINCCEVASNFAKYDGIEFGHRSNIHSSTEDLFAKTRHEGFSDIVRGRILTGNYFLLKNNYERYFIQALKLRRLISQDFQRVFRGGIDVLLTPVTLRDAPSYAEWIKQENREQSSLEDAFTGPVNMAGIPAVSVPCQLSQKGLPLSLQLIGQYLREEKLLSTAKWLEINVNFKHWS